jgi:hypothetical protein
MRRLALIVMLLALAGCVNDEPPGGQPAPANHAAAPAAGGAPSEAKGRTPFTHCLDLIRERNFEQALAICREAEKSNPGNPEIQKAIQMAQEATSGGGQAGEKKSD